MKIQSHLRWLYLLCAICSLPSFWACFESFTPLINYSGFNWLSIKSLSSFHLRTLTPGSSSWNTLPPTFYILLSLGLVLLLHLQALSTCIYVCTYRCIYLYIWICEIYMKINNRKEHGQSHRRTRHTLTHLSQWSYIRRR